MTSAGTAHCSGCRLHPQVFTLILGAFARTSSRSSAPSATAYPVPTCMHMTVSTQKRVCGQWDIVRLRTHISEQTFHTRIRYSGRATRLYLGVARPDQDTERRRGTMIELEVHLAVAQRTAVMEGATAAHYCVLDVSMVTHHDLVHDHRVDDLSGFGRRLSRPIMAKTDTDRTCRTVLCIRAGTACQTVRSAASRTHSSS
jgi:hypothetical protein